MSEPRIPEPKGAPTPSDHLATVAAQCSLASVSLSLGKPSAVGEALIALDVAKRALVWASLRLKGHDDGK